VLLEETHFRIASKRIPYLQINLTKDLQDLYSENYQNIIIRIQSLNKWKDILRTQVGQQSR